MRMSIVTTMEELQEGDHLVSEEIYKELALLIMVKTHQDWYLCVICRVNPASANRSVCEKCWPGVSSI
jgi:hypothetical protein